MTDWIQIDRAKVLNVTCSVTVTVLVKHSPGTPLFVWSATVDASETDSLWTVLNCHNARGRPRLSRGSIALRAHTNTVNIQHPVGMIQSAIALTSAALSTAANNWHVVPEQHA